MKTMQMARVEIKAERRPVVHYRGWRDVRWNQGFGRDLHLAVMAA